MFDATQEDAVGCGAWRMKLTFLELVYMFDATQEGAKDTTASEIKTLNTTKKTACRWGLKTFNSKTQWKFHKIKKKYCKITQNFDVRQNDQTNKVL